MPATRSSRISPLSERLWPRPSRLPRPRGGASLPRSRAALAGSCSPEALLVIALLAVVSGAALWWFSTHGHLLYYGDALAHLNIARRVVDSRTPGYAQIGTVWLPLPHLLMLPLAGDDSLWRSGLAGAIPSAVFFVMGGAFLFGAVRRALESRAAAATAVALYVLNPNVLYLQSIPMTEPIAAGTLFAVLYFSVCFRARPLLRHAAVAGLAALGGTLTRYEAWFLIPFVALYFFAAGGRRKWYAALLFGIIASLGPLYWLGHNLWFYGDPLEFYRGPWSAQAIYERALASGMQRYPGDGDPVTAARYYAAAARLCAGWPLVVMGAIGVGAAVVRRRWWPVTLLSLPALFYVWSLYSAGTPVFVPHLWPHSWYNTRYGLAALPLLAVGGASLVPLAPRRLRAGVGVGVVAASLAAWLPQPNPDAWVCWKESQVNSEGRRAWTREAAGYLRGRYRGGGIIYSFGDLTGVFLEAGIPLREALHSGNAPVFDAALARPDLFLREEWALAMSGDAVATALLRAHRHGPRYECVKMIALKGAPVIEIYRRAAQPVVDAGTAGPERPAR